MPKKNTLRTIVLIGLVVGLGLGGCVQATNLPAPTSPVPANTKAVVVATSASATVPAAATMASTAAPTTAPVVNIPCGQTGSMTILFLGSDATGGNPPFGADSVRLIKVNFDALKIGAITFSRDLIVKTAALKDAKYADAPLGLAFMYAKQAATGTDVEKNAAAAKVMVQVMNDDFAVLPDHYFTIQMDKVAAMIDTIGGVELTIPAAITTEHNIAFAAGKQTLNGAMATEYVRFLNPGGEAARTVRQNEFIKALQAKVLSVSILPKVPTLLTQFKDAVVTDLSNVQLISLACLAEKMPKDNITLGALDTSALVTNNVPNIDAIKAYITQIFGK